MPDEYIIPLSIDVAGVISKSTQAKASLTELGDAAKKASTDAKSGFDSAAQSATKMGNNVVDSSNKLSQQITTIERLKLTMQQLSAVRDLTFDTAKIKAYNLQIQQLQSQITQLSNVGKVGFDSLGNSINTASEKTGKFEAAIARVTNVSNIGATVVNRLNRQIIGLGISFLGGIIGAKAIEALIEYISNLDIFNSKAGVAQANLKNLNEVSQNAAKQYGEQSTNLRILYEATQDVTNSEHDRLLAAQELQKEFPSLFGNIKTEAILNGSAADAYDRATVAILENAKAKAALNKIQELAGKQLEADQQIQKIQNAESNEALRSAQQLAKVLQEGDATQGRAPVAPDKALQAGFDPTVNGFITAIRQRATDAIKVQQQNKTILQSQIDFLTSFAGGDKKIAEALIAGDKLPKTKDDSADILAKRKALLDQLAKLQNDYTAAQIAGIEDAETKEVALNDVGYQNKVNTLKRQQQDLIDQLKANKIPSLAPLIQENIRELSLVIAAETEKGEQDSQAIIAKYQALRLKAQQDSIRAIGVLLKDETQARVDAVNANYDKVIAESKKNGSLTTDYEKKLAQQRQSDISDVESKAILDRLTQENELQVAFIESQGRRPGELQATFSLEQQRAILANDIAFQQKRIAVLSATLALNGSLTPDQTKQLSDAAKKLNTDQGQDASNKEADKANIFKQLGIDNDTEANIIKYGNAASQIGKITSDLFSNLAQGAENQVNAIQKQIDAINTLLQADQNAVDKQQSLYDKGRANSLDAAKKQLADDQAQKAALLKNQENAQKKAQELQKAQLVADTIAQTSNLITAATEIYKSVSVIPVIGPALAFAAVAAMFAGFAVAKVTAFNAVNGATQTAEEGGVAGGDRHSSGGNKYISMDGKDANILEIERGERIFSRKNSEKHRKLFEAIQNNDFSKLDIGDVSIQDLLRGTGVMQQLEVARMTGSQNITLQDRANNVVVIANNSDKYLSSIDKKMDNLNKKDPVILDMGDYVWIDYGNGKTERRYK